MENGSAAFVLGVIFFSLRKPYGDTVPNRNSLVITAYSLSTESSTHKTTPKGLCRKHSFVSKVQLYLGYTLWNEQFVSGISNILLFDG